MKTIIQIIIKIGRQSQKIFYKIKRFKRLIIQKNSSNNAKSRKVGRNSHGFPTFLD